MAKIETLGILKGIQTALLLRQQGRMDEANRELQKSRLLMEQRRLDIEEGSAKAQRQYQQTALEMGAWKDMGDHWYNMMTSAKFPKSKPKPTIEELRYGQEQTDRSIAFNSLFGPGAKFSTPEQIAFRNKTLGIPEQKRYEVGGALVTPEGEVKYQSPPEQQPGFTLGRTRFDNAGNVIATAPPEPSPEKQLFEEYTTWTENKQKSFDEFHRKYRGQSDDPLAEFKAVDALPAVEKIRYERWWEKFNKKTANQDKDTVAIQELKAIVSADTPQIVKDGLKRKYFPSEDPKRETALETKVRLFEERKKRAATDKELDALILGVSTMERPQYLIWDDALAQLENSIAILTRKSATKVKDDKVISNMNEVIKEYSKHPEYRDSALKSVHAIAQGISLAQRPAFYNYASEILGENIAPLSEAEYQPTAPPTGAASTTQVPARPGLPATGTPPPAGGIDINSLSDEELTWYIAVQEAYRTGNIKEFDRLAKTAPTKRIRSLIQD